MIHKKKRIKDLSFLGLKVGEIYKYNGGPRGIYKNKKRHVDHDGKADKFNKLKPEENFIFVQSDIWITKKKGDVEIISCSEGLVDWEKIILERKGYEIIDVVKIAKSEEKYLNCNIKYKCNTTTYSGRLHIGKGDIFGWINIEQMTNEDFMQKFELQT